MFMIAHTDDDNGDDDFDGGIPTLMIGKAVPIAGELHSSNLYPNNNYYLTVGLQSCR